MNALNNKKILITRESSQAGSLKDKLTRLGAEVISVPTIKIADPPDSRLFDEAARRLTEFDWVVFSSSNAVKKTAERLSKLDIDMTSRLDLKIAAVGDQTAQSVREAGWKVDLIPDKFQAEDLSQKLLESGVSGKKIWIPRALKAREHMVKALSKAGAQVETTPIYQNVVPYENRDILRQTMDERGVDWVTFTSSSTVNNFFDILGRAPKQSQLPKLASIGSITTKTLNNLSLSPAFTADPQNLEGLCRGILDWEKNRHDR